MSSKISAFDQNQIVAALRIIKSECQKHEDCKECPFSQCGDCVISHVYPGDWKINDGENWKALR